jgi:hypothetical protein
MKNRNTLKMSNHAKSVLNRCQNGERLCRTVGTNGGYFFEPSGATAGQKSAEEAIASGKLAALDVGLFGVPQTWAMKAQAS